MTPLTKAHRITQALCVPSQAQQPGSKQTDAPVCQISVEIYSVLLAMSWVTITKAAVSLRANPPARPHHFSEDIEGHVKLYIQVNLQHVSTEFARIVTPASLPHLRAASARVLELKNCRASQVA